MTSEFSARVLLTVSRNNVPRWVVQALQGSAENGFRLSLAEDLDGVLSQVATGKVDVLLLDMSALSSAGADLAAWRRALPEDLPLILLVDAAREGEARRLLGHGVSDYVLRDMPSPQLLLRTLGFAIERRQLHGKLAAARKGQAHHASHDPLTGLPNRSRFREVLARGIDEAGGEEPLAVLFIDLDRFKSVNDSYGHDAGDLLLKRISERLRGCVRTGDVLARLGGDEFGCVLLRIGSPANAEKVGRQMLRALAEPVELAPDIHVACTPSIGIAMYPVDGDDASLLMKHADAAMYTAKQQGRACLRFFNAEVHAENVRRLTLQNDLRHALERGEFFLEYQPILDPATGEIRAVEALLRWRHPKLGIVPPLDFIPLAESGGLIPALGRWVLHTACKQNRAWQKQGLPPVRVAVNLSTLQFGTEDGLLEDVRHVLGETGLAPRWLELEITEGAAMENPRSAIATLSALRGMGLRIAIDDFGTGYSSLSYLQRLPIDTLKIDRSFVSDVINDSDSAAITRSIVHLAQSLNLETVAEGVEGADQAAWLQRLGCTLVQGYHYSRPLPAEQMAGLLERGLAVDGGEASSSRRSEWPDRINEALENTRGLPVMPETAAKLMQLMRSPEIHMRELNEVVSNDPALAAQIVRYANAPFFGFNGRIDSVERAVITVLGYDGVMSIGLGLVALGALPVARKAGLLREDFWWKSVAGAALAQAVATGRPLRKRVQPGLAYLAGLLRNLGRLFLASRFEGAWEAVEEARRQSPEEPCEVVERRILGRDHAAIGAALLRYWQMPEAVIAAVAGHHDEVAEGDFADYILLLQAADLLLDTPEDDPQRGARLAILSERLGVESSLVLDGWEAILAEREALESLARQLAAA